MEKISSLDFYKIWIETITNRKEELLKIWQIPKIFTNYIIGNDNSVIEEVAKKLNLLCYTQNYYSIDTILYRLEDKTPGIKPNTFWFRDIRVAFEHENNFKSGLYQEVSHLLITNCDLKVLVTYPNGDNKNELNYLHNIISGNRQSKKISDDESFIIIFGYEIDFSWEGYVYKLDKWNKIEN
jgi:hypothetical protein